MTGRLATDRPHVLKLYGAYMTPFGTQIGLNQYIGSGTPLTTEVRTLHTIVVSGRPGRYGPDARPWRSTDLLLSHEIRMRGDDRIRFELNVMNLFNQKTVRHRFVGLNRNRGAAAADLHRSISRTDTTIARDQRVAQRPGQSATIRDTAWPTSGTRVLQGHFMVKFLF